MNGFPKLFPHVLVIILVIITYAFLADTSMNVHGFSQKPNGHYQYLAESFLAGHTYLNVKPPAELLKLQNPYDFRQNSQVTFPDGKLMHEKLHDVSLYKNHFYLYFGPLPVITLYVPCQFITGYYPPDCFAVFLFLSIGFMICYGLMWKIKQDYFPQVSSQMMILCGLLLGFANNAPFLLLRPSFYEAAIASAFCFLSAAVFFLYRLFHNHFKVIDILFFSTMLGFSCAGRPHFALIALVLVPILIFYMMKYQRLSFMNLFAFSPLVFIGLGLLAYNRIRFDSVFEFGQAYQLIFDTHGLSSQLQFFNFKDMGFNLSEGFYNYFLRPFVKINSFPFVFFPDLFMERVKHGNIYEGSFGLLQTAPFVILVTLLPLQLIRYFREMHFRPVIHFIFSLLVIVAIISLFLMSLNSGTQRYLSDFSTFIIMLAIFSFWVFDKSLKDNMKDVFKMFFCLAGILSIYVGIVQAKALLFTGLYIRYYDFFWINNLIFFAAVSFEIFLIYTFIRRSSQFKS
jgi:hypothetical protein